MVVRKMGSNCLVQLSCTARGGGGGRWAGAERESQGRSCGCEKNGESSLGAVVLHRASVERMEVAGGLARREEGPGSLFICSSLTGRLWAVVFGQGCRADQTVECRRGVFFLHLHGRNRARWESDHQER